MIGNKRTTQTDSKQKLLEACNSNSISKNAITSATIRKALPAAAISCIRIRESPRPQKRANDCIHSDSFSPALKQEIQIEMKTLNTTS